MNHPLISVIVPVYNIEKHIRKCLESITAQTYKNLEIIVIDDGSKDGSANICREFAAKDDRIIFLSRENKGVSATRNEAIALAHGDYFSFIDGDDYLELDTYDYLMQIIKIHKVDIVNFEYFVTFPSNEISNHLSSETYGFCERYDAQRRILRHYPFACNKLFSKKVVAPIRFREDIARGEETLFARLCFENANFVWFDSRPLYHYVQSDDSTVRGNFKPTQLTAIKLYDIYEKFYSEKYPDLLYISMSSMNSLMVSLYFDMWNDKVDYRKEQRKVYDEFKKYYHYSAKRKDLSLRQKIKFKIFKFSPTLFCFLHKHGI